jgi:hypothetical protein
MLKGELQQLRELKGKCKNKDLIKEQKKNSEVPSRSSMQWYQSASQYLYAMYKRNWHCWKILLMIQLLILLFTILFIESEIAACRIALIVCCCVCALAVYARPFSNPVEVILECTSHIVNVFIIFYGVKVGWRTPMYQIHF